MSRIPGHGRGVRERGAAAVEFALILPLLLLIIAAIIDLSRLLYTQSMVTAAAREGVRMKAMGYSTSEALTRTQQAAIGLDPTKVAVSYPIDQCSLAPSPLNQVRIKVEYTEFSWVILGDVIQLLPGGVLPNPVPTSEASMRCGG